jgi:predicted nucleotidyltransferase
MAFGPDRELIATAEKYIELLRARQISFQAAWLFGSAVTGGFNEDSDIDIGLVMQDVNDRFHLELDLMRYRRQIDLRIEPHVFSAEEVNSPLYSEIAKGFRLA